MATERRGTEGMAATDGRVPGRRGRATRQKLLDCTAALIATTSWRSVKVIDIAREAGTSPATFYQYFENVEQAILVLAEGLTEDAADLVALVEGSWRGDQGWETATQVVDGFMAYWERHRAVIRVVDLATEEGDLRFQGMRTRALNAVTVTLAGVIASASGDRRREGEPDPMATASVLVSMMAHVAAHRYGYEFWGMRTSSLADSQARILYWTVTARRPPATPPRGGAGRANGRSEGAPSRPVNRAR